MHADARPEILAPAGGRAQMEAAVWAGADAVYFGLRDGLNARVRAESFALADLRSTMDWLRERGVRGYLALNTLVFDEELPKAERIVRAAAKAGVDALIVQDIGLAGLARRVAPSLPVHGSTQMSVTDAAGVAFAASLGVTRVVLGRELSLEDIRTVIAESPGIAVEVFVHGALCVSYSGQCYSSEAWGGRSANRGQCAQTCRLPYGLLVDGSLREQGDYRYLLSPQDLMAIDYLPALIDAGVTAFKIEGRLKGPAYVVATVSSYRAAVDRIWQARVEGGNPAEAFRLSQPARRRLAQVFSRGQDVDADGLTPGFLPGPRHQSVVIGRNPRHRGVFVGEVLAVDRGRVRVRLSGPVKRGDGVVFDDGRPESDEAGGNVHHVIDRHEHSVTGEHDRGEFHLVFGPDFDTRRIRPGQRVWRTRDSAQDGEIRLDPRHATRTVPVTVAVSGSLGEALRLTLGDPDDHSVAVTSRAALESARGAGLDEDRVRGAIGLFGDTPFRLQDLAVDLPAGLFLPIGEVKALRREAVDRLLELRRRHDRAAGLAASSLLTELLPDATGTPQASSASRLSLLCRTAEQVDAALQLDGIDEILVDFLEVHGLKQACEAVRLASRRLIVAAPRIFRPGEDRLLLYLKRLDADGILVRSAGLLQQLLRARASPVDPPIPPIHADFSLNAANVPAAQQLFDVGVERLTPTHDLDARQLAALARALPPDRRDRIEVVAHQHLPIFHTEHCVFARFLSDGNSYRDCGRPCERHRLHLRDDAGGEHLVLADIGCRNTVFNATAQSALAFVADLRAAGIARFRIELVDEPADQVATIVNAYRDVLQGIGQGRTAARTLADIVNANGHRQGIGPGSLAVRIEPARDRMKRPTSR